MSSSMKTPSRRMSMGVMPSHKKNRRVSVGGGAASSTPSSNNTGRRPPRGRKSMLPRVDGQENRIPRSPGGVTAPTAASRRRSVGGEKGTRRMSLIPPSAPTVKSDPRPINDKAFQHKCVKELLAFLLESGYDNPVSLKTLTRPSAKDFNNIATFMLRLVDSNFQRGSMKFEDEVSLNFKCIGYPYTISKTALVAAGSMHTWPALLAALAWLMDHVKTKKEHLFEDEDVSDTQLQSIQDLELQSDKVFFQYLGKAYQSFMRNDEQAFEQLEVGLAERFERDDSYLMQEVERITDLNAAIVERIEGLTHGAEDLASYEKKREEYATDLEQFHDLIRQMDAHKSALEQQVKERTATLKETNEKVDRMNSHIAQLKTTIATQPMSVDDQVGLESELKGLSEAYDRTVLVLEKRRTALVAAESELADACNNLETTLVTYNSKLSDMQLDPKYASLPLHEKAFLKKNQLLDGTVRQIVGVELEDEVHRKSQALKRDILSKVQTLKTSFQDSLDQLEMVIDSRREAESKLKIVSEKAMKCEKSLELEQSTHSAKLAVRKREVEAMESKVAARLDPVALEEQIAAYERQCAELEALRVQHQDSNGAKLTALQNEIDIALQLMKDHDEFYKQKMCELAEYWESKEIAEVKLPDVSAPSSNSVS